MLRYAGEVTYDELLLILLVGFLGGILVGMMLEEWLERLQP